MSGISHRQDLDLRVLAIGLAPTIVVFSLSWGSIGAASAVEPEKPHAIFIEGHGVAGYVNNEVEFQQPVSKAFEGCRISFYPQPPTAPRADAQEMLRHLRQADIFYTNSHASLSTFAIVVRDDEMLMPGEIQDFVNSPNRPALVIFNGCDSTGPREGKAARRLRLYTALGFDNDTKGRAFLGWRVSVHGFQGDSYFAKFLTHWTTPNGRRYPSLEESRAWMKGRGKGNAHSGNLDIIGHESLRYDYAMGMVGDVRTVGTWSVSRFRYNQKTASGGDKWVDNDSYNGTEVFIYRDKTYKVVLRAVDTRTRESGVVGVYQDQPWYLSDDSGKTILNVGFRANENEAFDWQKVQLNVARDSIVIVDPKRSEITLKRNE